MTGKRIFIFSITFMIMLVVCSNCQSQPGSNKSTLQHDREPAVAGQFYPDGKAALTDTLKAMFGRAVTKLSDKPVIAIIAPHAGYVFSGDVAASSYNQIEKKTYKNIFVIGSSHKMLFDGASVYSSGNFITPLGTVKVDMDLCRKLISDNPCFTGNIEAHLGEHTIEVQLPFLQYLLGNDLNLVPIVIGTQTAKTCQLIANAIKPYFNDDNLFVFSTDLSHYPGYSDAQISDRKITGAVMTNSPDKFLQTIKEIEAMNIPNLQTTMCGWTSILTLLDITRDMPGISFKMVAAKNSGDSHFGDKSRVVGYAAIAVESDRPQEKSTLKDFLTPTEKKALLKIARQTITEYIVHGKVPEVDKKSITTGMLQSCGAFVTLTENGQLRGCIGDFSADKSLYQTVQEMAVAASTRDNRFRRVSADEIDKLDIEISALTPMKKIKSIDEIVLGRDGIYIKKGISGGTFLPQVATETGWTKEEFLGHCAQDKAGIGWNGWKDADIFIYQAIVFGEKK
ncbi:MAG: AmmeMemoRadiSam system protein B [Bacteroidia bacterium]|nr:AmmeMemoRadiSam system protein B [Bacteroidia bacterium]